MFLLQLRNELWKLFGKKRTYIGSIMFLLAQAILILGLTYGRGPSRAIVRDLERNGYPVEHYLTNLTIACLVLGPIGYLMLPLYASLVGGDLVAKEAEDGTLRMILSRPVTRLRLLLLKWVAGAIFSLALVATLGVFGALFTRFFYPASGGLFVFVPEQRLVTTFEGAAGWERFAVVHLFMMAEACSLMSLAFMFSCFNIKPAAATILAISFYFISLIMNNMPYFQDWQDWILAHHLFVWVNLFRNPIPWWQIGESLSILAGYNLTFLIVGCAAFQVRDIKS
jgi:ABC-2 type transport system permease protein